MPDRLRDRQRQIASLQGGTRSIHDLNSGPGSRLVSNLALYMIGAVLLAAAVGIGANRLGVSNFWIAIVILVILGVALMAGVSRTRQPEDSPADKP